jgi:hypothetical protein
MAISLFYPFANEAFRRWLSAYPQVQLQADGLRDGYGWNVKPQAIMQLLDAGFDEVIWIDSDVFVTRDIRPLFRPLDEAVFVATEASCALDRNDHDGAGRRAQLWQLSVGRVLPWASLNSGILRVPKVPTTGEGYAEKPHSHAGRSRCIDRSLDFDRIRPYPIKSASQE